MLRNRRFWQAGLTGGLLIALLYFLLVYVRTGASDRYWSALAALLTTWRGLEVLVTFCALALVSLAGALWLQQKGRQTPLLAGCTAGGATGLGYGLWLLAATGAPDALAALAGLFWFAVPFVVGSGVMTAWFNRA